MANQNSTEVARIATRMAISNRDEEEILKESYFKQGVKVTAVNVGGNINEGAVIGATRDALMQVSNRANAQNVGGKIGIARKGEHISVCIFLSIGLLHLDEVVIGIGHRSLPE